MQYELSSEEVKEGLFDILSYFAEFCEKNGYRYSLAYGTLIGAVRHQDFIPWDDDVDVYMPRPDYEKMIKTFSEKSNGEYKLICMENGRSFFPFSKIIDPNIFTEQNQNKVDNRLWIDIFPVDGIPNNQKKQRVFFKKAKKMATGHMDCSFYLGIGSTPFRAIAKIPRQLFHKMIGLKYYNSKLSQLGCSYKFENCDLVAQVVWCADPKGVMPRTYFDDFVKLSFHGRKFNAVSHWHECLTSIYGDYMQLPPESKRKSHFLRAVIEK